MMTGSEKGKMGLLSCVFLIMGACIGSAIFSISGVTILYAGPSAVVSWIIAAAIYFGYGVVVSSLAVRYPYSGGIYVFPKLVFGGTAGSFCGFVSAWGYIVSNTIAIGFSAIYLGVYLQNGFPGLCSGPYAAIIACILAALVTVAGGKRSSRIQNTLVTVLLCCLSVYCAAALFGDGFDTSAFSSERFFSSGVRGRIGFVSAIPLSLVAYGGCIVVAFMASEVRNPGRNIPLSLLVGLGTVCIVYVLLIVCVAGTLPMDKLKSDTDSCYVPLLSSVSAGSLSRYGFLVTLLSVCGALAFFTTMIALMAVNVKAIQAMTRPSGKNEGLKSQSVPTLVLAVICILLCFLKEWTLELISLGAVLNIVSMSITCICLVAVGRRERSRKDRNRAGGTVATFVLPLAVTGIFLLCYVSDIVAGGGRIWIFTAIIYATGLGVYLFFREKVGKSMSVRGVVVHGKGHGHLHGMPTANLQPCVSSRITGDFSGVWKTRTIIGGRSYDSVTNVGLRPSDDDGTTPTIETHIIDFDEDIYGKEITVVFVEYLRPTKKFANLDALREQVKKDIEAHVRT